MAEKQGKSKSKALNFLIILMVIAGLGIMLYPTVSDWYNRKHESKVIADYSQTVQNNDAETNEAIWQEAQAYNAELAEKSKENGGFHFILTDEEKEAYEKVLDVSGTGIMGYVSVPSLNISLPVYHDTSEGVLQVAVGHLAGSSLPVGGANTHAVITGHTGLPSAKLFTDIDQLKEGDIFQITVLDHVLTYEVSDIRTVLPDELESLNIQEGEDLCTLVTCTPYGINTHRLLVTGHRIETPKTPEASQPATAVKTASWLEILPLLILAAVLAGLIVFILIEKKKMKQ